MAYASRTLYKAVKCAAEPAWRIGVRCDIHSPSELSKLLRGYAPIERDDPRILRLAEEVGIAATRAFSRRPAVDR